MQQKSHSFDCGSERGTSLSSEFCSKEDIICAKPFRTHAHLLLLVLSHGREALGADNTLRCSVRLPSLPGGCPLYDHRSRPRRSHPCQRNPSGILGGGNLRMAMTSAQQPIHIAVQLHTARCAAVNRARDRVNETIVRSVQVQVDGREHAVQVRGCRDDEHATKVATMACSTLRIKGTMGLYPISCDGEDVPDEVDVPEHQVRRRRRRQRHCALL